MSKTKVESLGKEQEKNTQFLYQETYLFYCQLTNDDPVEKGRKAKGNLKVPCKERAHPEVK